MLRLSERLPASERHRILDKHCRVYPSLADPRLAHDPVAVGHLQSLASLRAGLTVFLGAETPATFVLTAVAHSLQSQAVPKRPLA